MIIINNNNNNNDNNKIIFEYDVSSVSDTGILG